MKNPILICKISLRDIPDILQIMEEVRLGRWSAEGLENEIKRIDSLHLIAKIETQAIGFLTSRLITTDNCIEISNIAVRDKFRLQGIGKSLIDRVIQTARANQTHKIWLEVRESNFPAINFYQKNGFFINGRRKNFYTHPSENACLMELDMQSISNIK